MVSCVIGTYVLMYYITYITYLTYLFHQRQYLPMRLIYVFM